MGPEIAPTGTATKMLVVVQLIMPAFALLKMAVVRYRQSKPLPMIVTKVLDRPVVGVKLFISGVMVNELNVDTVCPFTDILMGLLPAAGGTETISWLGV